MGQKVGLQGSFQGFYTLSIKIAPKAFYNRVFGPKSLKIMSPLRVKG